MSNSSDQPTLHDPAASAPLGTGSSELVGQILNGRYQVGRKIGAGSMGDVYQGVVVRSGDTIALKVLKPEHAVREVFRHRFLREAKAAVRIDHRHVVDVIDFGEADGGWLYIAMEFLHGEDLARYLQRIGRLSWRQSCNLLQQAASGLAAAHKIGIVHRDVKPSNILLVDDKAGGALVKIVDFGVAKVADGPVSRVLTQADDVVGTVAYMSPEQAQGSEADMRSDVYALGATAYELATGRVPFEGSDMFHVMMGHLSRAPEPPAQLVPDFPPAANAFILRCLAKKPEERFQSMAEVLTILQSTASPDAAPLPPPLHDGHLETTVVSEMESSPPRPAPFEMSTLGPEFDDAPTGYFFRPVQPSLIGTHVGGPLLQAAEHAPQTPLGAPAPVVQTRTIRTHPVSEVAPDPVTGHTMPGSQVDVPIVDRRSLRHRGRRRQASAVVLAVFIATGIIAAAFIVYFVAIAP